MVKAKPVLRPRSAKRLADPICVRPDQDHDRKIRELRALGVDIAASVRPVLYEAIDDLYDQTVKKGA